MTGLAPAAAVEAVQEKSYTRDPDLWVTWRSVGGFGPVGEVGWSHDWSHDSHTHQRKHSQHYDHVIDHVTHF